MGHKHILDAVAGPKHPGQVFAITLTELNRFSGQILGAGAAIVSEVPLGALPAPQNFSRRSRHISGPDLGALLVEASENSGSHVTAEERNRDLYAVRGNVTAKNSWTA